LQDDSSGLDWWCLQMIFGDTFYEVFDLPLTLKIKRNI